MVLGYWDSHGYPNFPEEAPLIQELAIAMGTTTEGSTWPWDMVATPDNATITEFTRRSGGTYTTVAFLDGFVPPENATSISFDLRYQGGGGVKHLIVEDTWTATVSRAVPGNASGFVTVPANYYVVPGGIMPL